MAVKLFALIILLSVESFAFDFTTIGQKEIVDYIKNRADILYGGKLSERNFQDLLCNVVFTGLEEEALTFVFGRSASSEPIDDSPTGLASLVSDSETDSVPLKIFLTSDSRGTTDIKMATLTTTKSSSSKQSVGDFVVTNLQSENSDLTNLDGSITINLGESTDSLNLTMIKTVYISAEIKVTSLGSEWDENLLKNDGKLVSLLPSTKGSLYTIEYQSLIRETISSNDGDAFGGVKTSGNVLVHKNADGALSLAGRLIAGKIEPVLEDQAEELVDKFLTLNGAKSRQFFIKDAGIVAAKSNSILKPKAMKSTPSKSNLISGGSALLNFMRDLIKPQKAYYKENKKSKSKSKSKSNHHHHHHRNHGSKWYEKSNNDPYSWYSSYNSGWQNSWQYKYNYRYEWNWKTYKRYYFPYESKSPSKSTTEAPISSTSSTSKPEPVVVVTTPKPLLIPSTSPSPLPSSSPLVTTQPEKVTTPAAEPETIAPTMETVVEDEKMTATATPTVPELTEPELPPLPKGTTVSLWSSIIIQ